MTPRNDIAVTPQPAGDSDPLDLGRLAAAGVIDVVDGDPLVPITVIRLADADRHRRVDGDMPPSLAMLLLALYTAVGDIVVSFDAEPNIEGACWAGGRRHVQITDATGLTLPFGSRCRQAAAPRRCR